MPKSGRANAYYTPLKEVFTRLTYLNGSFQQFIAQYEHSRRQIQDSLNDRRRQKVGWASAAALVIRDLTEWPPDRWARHFSVGAHRRSGRRFLNSIEEIAAAHAGWAVSQSFEAFEAFLKDTAAVYLKRHPLALTDTAWTSRRNQSARLSTPRRLSDYRTFVRQAYGGADDLIKRLRRSVSTLQQCERRNNRVVDLQVWLRVIAQVRHAVVHSGGVLSTAQLGCLGAREVSLLRATFRGVPRNGGYRLRLTDKSAGEAIQRFAEYALLVFKEISAGDGLDWNVFRSLRIQV